MSVSFRHPDNMFSRQEAHFINQDTIKFAPVMPFKYADRVEPDKTSCKGLHCLARSICWKAYNHVQGTYRILPVQWLTIFL